MAQAVRMKTLETKKIELLHKVNMYGDTCASIRATSLHMASIRRSGVFDPDRFYEVNATLKSLAAQRRKLQKQIEARLDTLIKMAAKNAD